MTLLEELVDGASGDASVTSLLRKVKVVAARAGVAQLDEWVAHELNGYPDGVTLPEYRGPFGAEVRGDYSGPFNSGIKNGLVPPSGFPESFRDSQLFQIWFNESIAELEELGRADKDVLRAEWPSDVIGYTNRLMQQGKVNLYDGLGLQSAWRAVPKTMLIGVVDKVRTRILDLALELEKTAPDAGQTDAPSLPADTRNSVINMIYGGSTNIAVGSSNVTQTVNVPAGDREALDKRLTELGVPEPDIEQLHRAIEQDGGSVDGGVGPEASTWLVRMMPRVEGLGIGTTGSMLAGLLGQFLGIG
jgi:hypothetical protein